MRITELRLSQFRNLDSLGLTFENGVHFFQGSNGQGKTNLLEAIYLLATLRSFRLQDLRSLIQKESKLAVVEFEVEHDIEGSTCVRIELISDGKKQVFQDGERLQNLTELLGKFPAIAMTSQDIQLVRGSPSLRRRAIDLHLSLLDPQYLPLLRRYHRALRERNALLKDPKLIGILASYDRVLAESAVLLMGKRSLWLPALNECFKEIYHQFSTDESVSILWTQKESIPSLEQYLEMLQTNYQRDQRYQSTQKGPHRDDLHFIFEKKLAQEYASEGQQRSMVLALKLAQIEQIKKVKKMTPLLLADDILLELDQSRRQSFWKCLPETIQIFATGTEIPKFSSSVKSTPVFYKIDRGKILKKEM